MLEYMTIPAAKLTDAARQYLGKLGLNMLPSTVMGERGSTKLWKLKSSVFLGHSHSSLNSLGGALNIEFHSFNGDQPCPWPSHLVQKEPIVGKNNLTRTALVEENASRLIVGNDKEEVGLKRPRSNSSATENPHPPLAQKTHFGQPGCIALARSHQLPVASRGLARIVPEPVVVIEEDDEGVMEEDEDEMGLHRDHDMAGCQVNDESDGEESDTSLLDGKQEVEDMMGVEEDEQLQEDSRSRV
ncbi:hypothetical protein C8J56DRAFT_1140279 [Mycena floridula]|nr:hypothetical protein C8J56DRAFT_1140279 [Mycena floridula]